MAGFTDRLRSFMGMGNVERTKTSPFKEAGVPGYSVYGGFINSKETRWDLVGSERWIKASETLANISIVAAGTRYFLNLVSKPKWVFEPADESDEAKKIAEFVEEVIEQADTSWSRIVRRGGMYRYHGFGIQEWVARKRPDGKIGLADIEQRPSHTIQQWDIDPYGNILGVVQRGPQDGQAYYLARQKMVYLVDDALTDSPEGMGWFRQLIKPADLLERYLTLERTGFNRDLSGIPVGRAPFGELAELVGTAKPGGGTYSAEDVAGMSAGLAEFVQTKLKNPETSIVLDSVPYQDTTSDGTRSSSVMKWGIDLLTGSAESLPHLNTAINRLCYDMARIMGVENMLTGEGGSGSLALSRDKSESLWITINSTTNDMSESYNRDVIGPICDLNGIPEELRPKCKVEDVAFKDVEQLAAVLRDMATAGAVLTPDDPAIDDIRDLMGISKQPEMTPERMAMMQPPAPDPNADPNASPSGKGPGGGKPPKGEAKPSKDGQNATKKFNPNHHPAGSAQGGQFAPRDGGEGGGQTVEDILGPKATAKLRALIDDPNSTEEEILAVMRPLDENAENVVPTIGHDQGDYIHA